jgi:hypothetical protein
MQNKSRPLYTVGALEMKIMEQMVSANNTVALPTTKKGREKAKAS